MELLLNVDLGKSGDYTAISVLERIPRYLETGIPLHMRESKTVINEIHIRYLKRLELGMKYTDIVRAVRKVYDLPELASRTMLLVDATGVGKPVIDFMREEGLPAIGITITNGKTVNNNDEGYTVPKEQLVTSLQTVFQSDRIVFSEGITDEQMNNFVHELNHFTAKIKSDTKTVSYEAEKEKDHDDLVMSVAMGVWYMNRVYGATADFSPSIGKIDYDVLNYGIR